MLIQLLERLLIDRPISEQLFASDQCRALALTLLWPSYTVRKRAVLAIQRVLSMHDCNQFVLTTLDQMLLAIDERWFEQVCQIINTRYLFL